MSHNGISVFFRYTMNGMIYRKDYRMLALVTAMALTVVTVVFKLPDLYIASTQTTWGVNPIQRFGKSSKSYKVSLTIPPVSDLKKHSRAYLEDLYHRYVENIQVVCKDQIHYGKEGDGGYFYCRDVNLKPPCVMYSFGTRNDYSFDDEISNQIGCDVHSVDPGDGQTDHKRSERVWFHRLGLGGRTRTLDKLNWKIYSLPDIRKLLHHENMKCCVLVAVACVCTLATIYVSLPSRTKYPATVFPCKNAHCEDVTKKDAYISKRVQLLRDRARTLQERCEQQDDETTAGEPHGANHFLVSDTYQLVFCYIPKVACSNVKRIFLILNGIVNKANPVDITNDEVNGNAKKLKRLTSYSKDGVRHRLQNYTKVMFVRDPFERLISAFNDRFHGTGGVYYRKTVTKRIIQTLRLDKVHAGNITFANFIQYLIIENGKHKAFDEHWETYNRICDPCHIQYDYIGKYETINEDMGAVLKEIGADFIHFPARNDLHQYRSITASADLIEAFYKDIPDSHIKQLKEIYAKDMLLFGLEAPKAVVRLEE